MTVQKCLRSLLDKIFVLQFDILHEVRLIGTLLKNTMKKFIEKSRLALLVIL